MGLRYFPNYAVPYAAPPVVGSEHGGLACLLDAAEQGEQGMPGMPGKDGVAGGAGPGGMDGEDGEEGLPGIPGAVGAQGPQGIPGMPGDDADDAGIWPMFPTIGPSLRAIDAISQNSSFPDTSIYYTAYGTAALYTLNAQGRALLAWVDILGAVDKQPYYSAGGLGLAYEITSAWRTFATTSSSANLAALLTDELGSGSAVFSSVLVGLQWEDFIFPDFGPATTGATPAAGSIAPASGQPTIRTYDFDQTTAEYVAWVWCPPANWDGGTITYQITWAHGAAATFNVVWRCRAVAVSSGDTLAVALGTLVAMTVSGGTTDMQYTTSASSALTVAGTPAQGDRVYFELHRNAGAGADTLDADAKLIAVRITYTTTGTGNTGV